MKGASFQVGVELDFFKPSRRAKALFIARGHVDRRATAFCFGLSAFKNYDVSGHGNKIL